MMKVKNKTEVDAHASLARNAARTIRARQEAMLEFAPCLEDPEKVIELHEMRIAAKRLRYTMEIFSNLFDASAAARKTFSTALDAVKSLQEHLGELHDADVLVPQLTQHLACLLQPGYGTEKGEPIVGVHRVDFQACQGLLTICQETREARDKRFATLLGEWQRLQERAVFTHLDALLSTMDEEVAREIRTTDNALTATQAALAASWNGEIHDAKDTNNSHAQSNATDAGTVGPIDAPGTRRHRHGDASGNSSGYSRSRPHSDKSPPEGGV